MRRIWALLMALAMALSLCGCGDDGSGKGFRLPLEDEPRQLDPQTATDPASVTVIAALFEGLTRLDETGAVVDGAATHTLSADKRTYTFTLRESYWSTLSVRGEETPWDEPTRVIADDFVFGLQRALSPENQSGTATSLYAIEHAAAVHRGDKPLSALGVKAVDDRTLTITLAKPDDTFLSRLAGSPAMPCNRDFFVHTAGRYGLEKPYVLSNGAFSLTAWTHDHSLLLNKNGRYHAAATITPAAVRFVVEADEPVAALQEGLLDAAFLTTAEADAARKADVPVLSLRDSMRQLSFQTAAEPLTNADIRRALQQAIEWQTVHDYLTAHGETPANGYIPPDAVRGGKPYRNELNTFSFKTDVSAAQTALGKGLAALYPDEKDPRLPSLTLVAADDEVSANLARYLVQSWQRNLKIYCGLELVSETTLAARVHSGSYQLALHTVIGGGLTAADNLAAYSTGAANNLTGFSDVSFDEQYTAAQSGGNTEEKAECILHDRCPVIPLSFPARHIGIAANTEGITVRPFDGGTYGSAYEFNHAKKFED